MILAAHQSHYLPGLGYLDKIDRADIFVVLDDVQYEKNGWQNRNKIRTAQGLQWLTVPILHKFGQVLCDVRIDHRQDWRRTHVRALTLNYQRAPFFKLYQPFLDGTYQKSWDYLVEINLHWLYFLVEAIGIRPGRLMLSSELSLKDLKGTDRLIHLCKLLKADTYLSGRGAKAYLEAKRFEEEGIQLVFQEFANPSYEHLAPPIGRQDAVSAIDLLFNQGPKSLEILRKGHSS